MERSKRWNNPQKTDPTTIEMKSLIDKSLDHAMQSAILYAPDGMCTVV